MESWRLVWRTGYQPNISTRGLEALREALRADDRRLVQGSTTTPPPLMCVQDFPVEAACAVAFTGWAGEELLTVGEVEEYFARLSYECDKLVGESGCKWWLNHWDDTPRQEVFRELLEEVEAELATRTHHAA